MTTIRVATPVLVSAVDGRLMCDFADLHGFLEKVAGTPLWTHQLPAAIGQIGPHLAAQHPWAATVDVPREMPAGQDPEMFWRAVAERLVAEHGPEHEVTPMTTFAASNPVTDLVGMVGPDRVVPVIMDGDRS